MKENIKFKIGKREDMKSGKFISQQWASRARSPGSGDGQQEQETRVQLVPGQRQCQRQEAAEEVGGVIRQ